METTWDGLPIAEENPRFVSVVVWRHGAAGREYLVLHRSQREWTGDWAWTNPSGARQPGEDPMAAARRELFEEAGLVLELTPVERGRPELAFFVTEAPAEAEVLLDHEHNAFTWVDIDEACRRCLPAMVAETFEDVDRLLRQ